MVDLFSVVKMFVEILQGQCTEHCEDDGGCSRGHLELGKIRSLLVQVEGITPLLRPRFGKRQGVEQYHHLKFFLVDARQATIAEPRNGQSREEYDLPEQPTSWYNEKLAYELDGEQNGANSNTMEASPASRLFPIFDGNPAFHDILTAFSPPLSTMNWSPSSNSPSQAGEWRDGTGW